VKPRCQWLTPQQLHEQLKSHVVTLFHDHEVAILLHASFLASPPPREAHFERSSHMRFQQGSGHHRLLKEVKVDATEMDAWRNVCAGKLSPDRLHLHACSPRAATAFAGAASAAVAPAAAFGHLP